MACPCGSRIKLVASPSFTGMMLDATLIEIDLDLYIDAVITGSLIGAVEVTFTERGFGPAHRCELLACSQDTSTVGR